MRIVIVTEGETCSWEDCINPATAIAHGRSFLDEPGHGLNVYCERHARIIEAENNPEYIVSCPNCQCRFGVN